MKKETVIVRLSHFHYVEHTKLEAACMGFVTLKYEAVSPLYTLCYNVMYYVIIM